MFILDKKRCRLCLESPEVAAGVSIKGPPVGVQTGLMAFGALALYTSSHVHACGAYMWLPGASVLNSLRMCDESCGWESSSTLRGPLLAAHMLNSKEAIDLFVFHHVPVSLSYLFGFVSACLSLHPCLSSHVSFFFFLLILDRRKD